MPRKKVPSRRVPSSFVEDYERYVEQTLKPARAVVYKILHEEWRADNYWKRYRYKRKRSTAIPRPIQRIRTRIKTPFSLIDKFERLKDDFPEGAIYHNFPKMTDFLGARVVTYFLPHLKMIDEDIRRGRHFELQPGVKPRAYIARSTLDRLGFELEEFDLAEPKWSGYSSIHYFLRLTENHNRGVNPWFELQVRTAAEEVWAEIHHQLGYKPQQQTHFSVERQFRVIASHLTAIDDHFDFLYDRLTYLQSESDPHPEDKLNAENFPQILDTYNVGVQQDEMVDLLKIVADHGMTTVAEFQRIARAEIVEAITSEYLRAGVRITARHLVGTLLLLKPKSTQADAYAAVQFNLKLAELTRRTIDVGDFDELDEPGDT